MVYIASAAWMFSAALLGDWRRIRDHVATLGIGLGVLLAGLLAAVPGTATAAAGIFDRFSPDRGMMAELVLTQGAWLVVAVCGLAGYALARRARALRSVRGRVLEVVALGAGSAFVPAQSHHLAAIVILVPAAVAAVAMTLLDGVDRSVVVLAGLLATIAFAFAFLLAHAIGAVAIPSLLLGIISLAYAVGRWADLHPGAVERPSALLWVSLACGFVLVRLI